MILGSQSPRIFSYEVTLHLVRLAKASQAIEGPEQTWINNGTQAHPNWQPIPEHDPNS